MKLQIAFDLLELDKALLIAHEIEDYTDILEVGSLLIYKYGDTAVKQFRQSFPNKIILADAKIADRGKEVVTIFAQAGADWVTVMAGTGRNVIHTACATAHDLGKKVMLDLLDTSSLGQSALEAKSLGVDALLFHKPSDDDAQLTFLDRWDMVRENTQLPIFISAPITRENIHELIAINPTGIIISKAITNADNPQEEARYFHKLIV
ncbi:MAG: orotidine 5'-phosphate decarboxylase / HUMPS family protein [Candidatus Babeliaceae bacterium]|jgi:3-hexulose-6-phosphate synthase